MYLGILCPAIERRGISFNIDPESLKVCQRQGHIWLAFDIIASATEAVGGRYMMIECRNEAKLLKFYGDNSFSEIDHIPDDDVPMVQMIRKI
jgi:hypothetical protein